jgi:hypothetical protein
MSAHDAIISALTEVVKVVEGEPGAIPKQLLLRIGAPDYLIAQIRSTQGYDDEVMALMDKLEELKGWYT